METLEINLDKIRMYSDSLFIYQPRFVDPEKNLIKGIVRMRNGQLQEIEANRNDSDSPFIRDVFSQYTEEEIEMYTVKENHLRVLIHENEKRAADDAKQAQKNEATFEAKADALQIPFIKDHPDKEVARKIRKAKNPTEVAALVALAMLQSNEHNANLETQRQ